MGAVPKHKLSKSRRDKRRTHDALHPHHIVPCSKCGEMKRAHHLCLECGTYGDRQIMPAMSENK